MNTKTTKSSKTAKKNHASKSDTSKKSRFAKLLLTISLALLVIGGFAYYQAQQIINQTTTATDTHFVVKRGSSFSATARALEQAGIIQHAWALKALAKQQGKDHLLKPGEYDLSQVLSLGELLNKLTNGDVITHTVTLIDGWTYQQFKVHLAKQEHLIVATQDLSDAQIMQAVGAPDTHPEGQFAPETYQFEKGDSDLDILKRSFNRQQQVIDKAWEERVESPHIKNKQSALTLASIIEKETGKASERKEISGVFHNRLRIGMRLQTDPTVIYGMGDLYKGNIKRIHLRTDTPYNTYTRYGLPPTPIAMPGKASIEAALDPATTKALYFVGKGDGSHYFSKNLKEHNRAVAKYQLGK